MFMIGGDEYMFLFNSLTTNILATIAVSILILGFIWFQHRYTRKKDEEINKLVLVILYILLFFLIVAGVLFILYTWNFDYNTFLNDFWDDAVIFALAKIGNIVLTVIIIFFISLLLRLSKVILKKSAQREGPNKKRRITMLKVTNSLINYTVKIIAALVILSIWGVDVIPALAGLGILGLVVGLGAQSLIKDLISGFFIIFEHHFDVGDVIEINGFKGRVIDIGLKTTRVQNWKNDIKIFANGSINESINYSVADSVAIIEFGIAYRENIQQTIDILNEELPKYKDLLPNLIENPIVLGVIDLASSSVNIRVIAKTLPETQYAVERAIRQGIKEILDQHGIEIPFPQVVVHGTKEK